MKDHDPSYASPPGDAAERNLGELASEADDEAGAVRPKSGSRRSRGREAAAAGARTSVIIAENRKHVNPSKPKNLNVSLTYADLGAAGITIEVLTDATAKLGLVPGTGPERAPPALVDLLVNAQRSARRASRTPSVEALAVVLEQRLQGIQQQWDRRVDPNGRTYVVDLPAGRLLIRSRRTAAALSELVTYALRLSKRPLLITAPTGTGKELAASLAASVMGHDTKVVRVNCAQFPAQTLISQLFGHRRGSFTGADADHAGLFTEARGRVLFLDEVHALGSHQQALLRVVEQGTFRPIGAQRDENVGDTAFILATARPDLIDEMLLARCVTVRLPALAERIEEVVPLCRLFATATGKSLALDALVELGSRSWPDNVRGVQLVIEQAAALAEEAGSSWIRGAHLPRPGGNADRDEQIVSLLNETGGNRSEVARMLNVNKSTVCRAAKRAGDETREP